MSEGEYSYLPAGYHSVTPYLTVKDAAGALAFYGEAFGAVETMRMERPDAPGDIMHAEFRIGNSTMMISGEYAEMGAVAPEVGTGTVFMIYVEDCDGAYAQAMAAGATSIEEPVDQFWGDRMGRVADAFGYRWSIAQKVREVTPEEIAKAVEAMSSEG
jgi:PhnB protein